MECVAELKLNAHDGLLVLVMDILEATTAESGLLNVIFSTPSW